MALNCKVLFSINVGLRTAISVISPFLRGSWEKRYVYPVTQHQKTKLTRVMYSKRKFNGSRVYLVEFRFLNHGYFFFEIFKLFSTFFTFVRQELPIFLCYIATNVYYSSVMQVDTVNAFWTITAVPSTADVLDFDVYESI